MLGVGAVEGPLATILRYHVVAGTGRAPAVWGALLRGVGRWPHGGLAIMRRVLMQCMRIKYSTWSQFSTTVAIDVAIPVRLRFLLCGLRVISPLPRDTPPYCTTGCRMSR